MKAPVTWLREFADLPDSADVTGIAEGIANAGFEIASIDGDVVDFEITANRPDCLSVRGLAREAAVVFRVRSPQVPGPQAHGGDVDETEVPVTIESDQCGRYALGLADVTVGPSPSWLADRLTACGIRPINNVVDVTNYVLLETGQPMHAFDLARLAGPEIRVRQARAGETLTTLDRQERKLDPSMLVIADAQRAVAIAGVMGGAATEVSGSTARIALESAWFRPETVRATSKRLGLKTEASARFERGADPGAAVTAMLRALDLLEQIGAGRRIGGIRDVHPAPVPARTVALRRPHLDRLLGGHVPDADVTRILEGLGFAATPDAALGGWQVIVPSWRVDVSREADLIEEVGRHWGLNRLPPAFPALRTAPHRPDAGVLRARRLRRVLCGAGLQEAVTFTFIERSAAEPFAADADALVAIANPLSEKFASLRPSLLPGLLDALIYNRRRDIPDVRLFESGSVFSAQGERQCVGWVLCGAQLSHWSQPEIGVDVFDALGVGDLIAEAFGLTVTSEPADGPAWFVPGRCATLLADTAAGPRSLGSAGQIVPDLLSKRGLPAGVVVVAGEIDLAAVPAGAEAPTRVTPLPRHPAVLRDVSIFIDAGLPAAAVRGTIRANAPATLVDVREFDRYQGKGVPEGRVSLSLRLTFQDRDRTLTDAEVQQALETIVAALSSVHGATLRGT